MSRQSAWSWVVALATAGLCRAEELRVPQDYPTIQDALSAAADGDVVLVADGVYSGDGNRVLFFAGKGVSLRSANGADACIIDAENEAPAFWLVAFEPPEAVIEGFTIRGGGGSTGGAAFCHHTTRPTFIGCVFENNGDAYARGGAIYVDTQSAPTFIHCTFSNNHAGYGGALYVVGGSRATLINCQLVNNAAENDGGAIFTAGAEVELSNCTLAGNHAPRGGVVYGGFNTNLEIIDSILWDNAQPLLEGEVAATITFSDVQGGWPGEGNIDRDPRFVSGPRGEFYLSQKRAGQRRNSPCVNAGSTQADDLGLHRRTTRSDEGKDRKTVDMGFHYPR